MFKCRWRPPAYSRRHIDGAVLPEAAQSNEIFNEHLSDS